MPALNRRQPSLDLRKAANARVSIDSEESRKEALWIVTENLEKLEKPQQEMDFPASKLSALPSRQKAGHHLRLTTKADLHDKYQSDEEEASPSPEDYSDSNDESFEDDSITYEVHDPTDLDSHSITSSLHPNASSINIATTILLFPAPHRPRLINITRLAPLQIRKRPPPATRTPFHKRLTSLDENQAYPGPSSSASTTSSSYYTADLPLRRENYPPTTRIPQPESWLPATAVEELEQEAQLPPPYKDTEESIYFPEPHTSPTTYAELDPYSLSPPTLVRTFSNTPSAYSPYSNYDRQHSRTSLSSSTGTSSRGSGSGWRGKVRGLGLVRKASSDHGGQGSLNQRACVDGGWGKAREKGKMVARGAAERQEFMGIPPFPFEGVLA